MRSLNNNPKNVDRALKEGLPPNTRHNVYTGKYPYWRDEDRLGNAWDQDADEKFKQHFEQMREEMKGD